MFRYILCACLVLAGCAGTKQSAYIDTPVRVTGEGRTFEEAKQNAFSNAMEYAVGAVVVTETQVQRKRLVKDEILKHSSGYVDDYVVVNRVDEPNRVTLIMDVRVKHSAIAERIMNVKTATGEIQGERLSETHKSFMQSKLSGDNLLRKILDDYPARAFNVEKKEVEYLVNINRQPVISVRYVVRWNYKYLQALNEALELTQDPRDRYLSQVRIDVQSKSPNNWLFGSTDSYYFNDTLRSDMIMNTFRRPFFVYTLYKDKDGRVVKRGCSEAYVMNGKTKNGAFTVEGNETIDMTVDRTIKINAEAIRNIVNIELSIEPNACTFIS